MKKIKYIFLFIILFLTSCSTPLSSQKHTGTSDDPYLIYTVSDFMDLGGRLIHQQDNYKNKYFKLMNDLDFSGIPYTPFGMSMTNYFDGYFDGNGYTLKNISINDYYLYNGVFGVVGPNGQVHNLNVKNFKKNNTSENISYSGGIAGFTFYGGIINNCNTSGNITSYTNPSDDYTFYSYVGGIVGKAYNYIGNCSSSINLTGDVVGGIVGFGNNYTIFNCSYSNATINANKTAGGIVGIFENSTYFNFYLMNSLVNDVLIQSKYIAGGLIGTVNGKININKCQSNAKIDVSNIDIFWGGGIIGGNTYNGDLTSTLISIEDCISMVDFDVLMADSSSKIYISPFIPYEKVSISFSAYKGYMNLRNGTYYLYYGKSQYRCKAIFDTKTNINIYEDKYENYIYSTDNDYNIISNCININLKWLNISNIIALKDEIEIFSNLKGKGTQEDPFLISNFEELSYIYVSKYPYYFELTNDIDATNYDISDFSLINDQGCFILNGNNYSVNNLSFNKRNKYGRSLFNSLNDSHIKNISFNNLLCTYDDNFSYDNISIFNEINNSTIENIAINLNITNTFTTEKNHEIKTSLYTSIKSSNLLNVDLNLNFSEKYDVDLFVFKDIYEKCEIDELKINISCPNYIYIDLISTYNSLASLTNNIINIYNASSITIDEIIQNDTYLVDKLIVNYNNEIAYPKIK